MLYEFMENIDDIEKTFTGHFNDTGTLHQQYPIYDTGPRGNGPNMRLDAEAGSGEEPDVALAFKAFKNDLVDIVETGDVFGSPDWSAWHATLNGFRANRRIPDVVSINKAQMFAEWSKRREQWELTLYVVVNMEWPTNNPQQLELVLQNV